MSGSSEEQLATPPRTRLVSKESSNWTPRERERLATPREQAWAPEEAREEASPSPRPAIPSLGSTPATGSAAPGFSPSPAGALGASPPPPSFPTQPPALPPLPGAPPERPPPTQRSQSGTADSDGTVRVRVVARVRPLLQLETAGHTRPLSCVEVAGQKVTAGRHCFSFDQVFGPDAAQEEVYADCVEPLVDAAFDGMNAAFLAYGQTGSGKTYTMGTSGVASAPPGALQRAIRSLFQRARALDEQDGSMEVRVTFIEILTIGAGSHYGGKAGEEVRDLLSLGRSAPAMVRECGFGGNIRLEGVEEHSVTEEAQALRLVALGSAARATACTRTNDSSSRSHAIFTMELTQRRFSAGVPSTLRAKFHFVDLAGSEKVKVSGVEGQQLNQAININYGLFVLGKVITALSEGHSHVPLRESTLTRFLQHSLGGNSRTCMVACVSPAEINLAESISTLTYGAKAKKIRNTPVVNKDVSCPNCAAMQARLNSLTSPCHPLLKPNGAKLDLAATDSGLPRHGQSNGGGGPPRGHMEQLRQQNKRLEKELRDLRARRESCDSRVMEAIAACSEELQDLKEGGANGRAPFCEGTPRFGKTFGGIRWSAESLLSPSQGPCPSFAGDSPGPMTTAPAGSPAGDLASAAGGDAASEEVELRRQLQSAEASAARSNELFHRLSERFAALQRAVQEKQLEVDDTLLLELPSPSCVLGGGEAPNCGSGAPASGSAVAALLHLSDGAFGFPGAGDFEEDMELSSLEREAGRKRDLLACMEENRHATAVLEAISEEKLKQQEVARDLAERELQRLEAELETARTERQQEVRSLQERCDQKAAALKEKNAALQREREEIRRLRGMQSRLSTRLKVLSDSIRQVTEQRDQLKERLTEERRLRKKEEASAKKERQAAQGKIKNLISRVAALESAPTPPAPQGRASAGGGGGGSSTSTTASAAPPLLHGASTGTLPGFMRSPPRLSDVSRAASTACIGTPPDMSPRCFASEAQLLGQQQQQQQQAGGKDGHSAVEQGGPWALLLHSTGERARRKQVAMQVQEDFDELHAKVLAVTAERERLAVSAEVSNSEGHAALESLEMELEGLTGALKYQREKVWMAAREVEVLPNQDAAEAARKLAEGMGREDLLEGLAYLSKEASACQEELASSKALQEHQGAELAAGRTSLAQFQQQAAEQAQAFDAACADYEHRVAYLLGRLHDDGRLDPVDAIGEETFSFLRRRVVELEQTVEKMRQDAQQSGKRRVEQDLELISRCQSLTSENKSLRAQVSEATDTVDRTNARAATREAQLAQRVSALEAQLEAAAAGSAPAMTPGVQEGHLAAEAASVAAARPAAAAAGGAVSSEVAGAAAAMLGAVGASSSATDALAPLLAWQGLDAGWRDAGLNDEARRELLEDLATDVRALCERRLQEHHAWRQSQEERIDRLGREVAALEALLGEAAEEPAVACTSLLDRARALEQSYSALANLKESRTKELDEIQQQIEALRRRLGSPPDDAPVDKEGPGALSSSAMTEARVRLKALEAVERERQSVLGAALTRLSHCWDALGLTVPDELEPQEVHMLQGVEVVSDDLLKFCESRELALSALQSELEREVADLRERVDQWRQCLVHFGMSLPDDPQLPYIPAVRILRAATADAEIAASDFLQHEKVALQAFFESTRLPNIESALDELNSVPGNYMHQLEVLRHHWDRTVVQRQEYRKLVDVIAAREALEVEMREFDLEASDPQRFRKRNYSGVEENRRRVEYQRRLRALDASLSASSAEWEEREGLPFHVNGTPYVGNEILNADHTHMYAWTETQLAQKEALQGAGFQPPERRRGEGFLTERGRAGVRQSQSQQELSHADQVQRCQSAPRGLRGVSSGSSSGAGGLRRSVGTQRHKGTSLRLGLGTPAR